MTRLITVLGVVQGVGFRPFVARLAQQMNISGTVLNSGGIVQIIANAPKEAIDNFVHRLELHPPKSAKVQQVLIKEIAEQHFDGFKIVQSTSNEDETPLLPPDLPLCDDCRHELYDTNDRRYFYPFISCVSCGPRYSIIERIPFDRETTTMDDFAMCPECEREYTEDNNRRRHAQTISCHHCGPQLILNCDNETYNKDEALNKAIELLKFGNVLAMKGIGGYQFACLPTNKNAVEQLRLLKHRDKKPFAVMFSNTQSTEKVCFISEQEANLLTSSAYPIVLLQKRGEHFCQEVSGESRFIGAMLAYTPLHLLLTDACGPLIMTSGNLTSEPIITGDEDVLALNSPYLAGVLYHKRRIVTPLDDSVARVVCGKPQLIRRSRGYVPIPIILNKTTDKMILAMGVDLKSCFCLYQNNRAYLSQYFGDMESYQISNLYKQTVTHMQSLFGILPEVIACDMHPHYITSSIAENLAKITNKKIVKIQHHHAHAASVMAEHGLNSCIGVVFDGTGYGTDGTVWGGEFLLCNGAEFKRVAHLSNVTLCGGDMAAKNAKLTAYSYLYAAGETMNNGEFATIQSAIQNNINTHKSSSMGRLFDAVSAVLDIRTENSYEGECAIALENAAAIYQKSGEQPYPLQFQMDSNQSALLVNQTELLKIIYKAYQNGANKGALALGFHNAVAKMVLEVCTKIRETNKENNVALSGGVFANFLLTENCVNLLQNAGFKVYLNREVPTNDSGVALGQAWLCGQMT